MAGPCVSSYRASVCPECLDFYSAFSILRRQSLPQRWCEGAEHLLRTNDARSAASQGGRGDDRGFVVPGVLYPGFPPTPVTSSSAAAAAASAATTAAAAAAAAAGVREPGVDAEAMAWITHAETDGYAPAPAAPLALQVKAVVLRYHSTLVTPAHLC